MKSPFQTFVEEEKKREDKEEEEERLLLKGEKEENHLLKFVEKGGEENQSLKIDDHLLQRIEMKEKVDHHPQRILHPQKKKNMEAPRMTHKSRQLWRIFILKLLTNKNCCFSWWKGSFEN